MTTYQEQISRLQSLMESNPRLCEVRTLSMGDDGDLHLVARLSRSTFGRGLYFHVQSAPCGGMRLVVPNLIHAPHHEAFGHLHTELVRANGALRGRLVMDDEGRVHYDLGLQTVETLDGNVLETIIGVLEKDLVIAQQILFTVGIASLLPLEISLVQRMLARVEGDEEETEGPSTSEEEGFSGRMAV